MSDTIQNKKKLKEKIKWLQPLKTLYSSQSKDSSMFHISVRADQSHSSQFTMHGNMCLFMKCAKIKLV